MKIIAQNRKALHDYTVLESIEAGIVLTGDEVKALRAGQGSLSGAFGVFRQGELFLINCTIALYEKAYTKQKELTTRSRKLLLKKRELMRLLGDVSQKGITIIPLKLYLNDKSLIKVELAIGKTKKAIDKKQALKERDIDRQARRELKDVYKY